MASLFSLSDDLLRRVLEGIPQRDAVALCATSKQLDAFYPTNVTRAFAPDATAAEYTAMCEWIVKRRVSSFALAVRASLWNEVAPKVLAGTRFDRVTLAPSNHHAVMPSDAKPWTPDCATFVSGFASDPRLITVSHRTLVSFHNLHTDPPSIPEPCDLPDFPVVPGAEPYNSISCTGHIKGLDRLPLNADIHVTGGVLGQKEIDHLARARTSLRLVNCAIHASVQPRAFTSYELSVSLNMLRIIETSACTTLVVILRGGDEYPETIPSFPNLTSVYFSGYTHDRLEAFRFASIFPRVKKSYAFEVYDPM